MSDAAAVQDTAKTGDPPWQRLRRRLAALAAASPIDGIRALYAAQVTFISIASLFFAFLLNYQNTFWALLTVPLIVQPNAGLTIWRSLSRIVSTIFGGVLALVLVALFEQNGVAMIAALSLWLFAVGFLARFEIGLDAYAYAAAGLEAMIVVLLTGGDGDTALPLALARTTETLLPISVAFMISLVIFPQSAQSTLLAGLRQARGSVLDVARAAVAAPFAIRSDMRGKAIASLSAIHDNLRAMELERANAVPAIAKYEAATIDLNRLVASAERTGLMLADFDGGLPASVELARQDLANGLDRMSLNPGTLEHLRVVVRDFGEVLNRLDRRIASGASAVDLDPAMRREAAGLHAICSLARDVSTFLAANAAVLDPAASVPQRRSVGARYPDIRAAVERGARPACVVAIMATIWIATASPAFQTLTTVAGAVLLTFPAIAPRAVMAGAGKTFGLGYAAALLPVLALQIVLPYAESFAVFSLIIGGYIFTLFYVASAPGRVVFGITGMILLGIGLQPSNTPSYNPLILFNAITTYAMLPVVMGAGLSIIFPETEGWLRRHLRRASTALLKRAAGGRDDRPHRFLAQSLDVLADYGGSLDPAQPAKAHLVDRGAAVMAVGLELYGLRRTLRQATAPAGLARDLDSAASAMAAVAAGRADPNAKREAVSALEAAASAGLSACDVDTSDAERATIARFLIGMTFLGAALRSGHLTSGEDDAHAA